MEGTVRSFSEREEERILAGMAGVLRGIEAAFGVQASLDYEKVNPAVVNDPRLAAMAQRVFAAVLGAENVLPAEPLTIGEDFALYSRRLPALFFFLGVGGGQALHAPGFTVDEEALRAAPALLAAVAFAFLEQGGLE
jgi:metal-dependent amidase/aminoacylase/carboxypeptidase family protein